MSNYVIINYEGNREAFKMSAGELVATSRFHNVSKGSGPNWDYERHIEVASDPIGAQVYALLMAL